MVIGPIPDAEVLPLKEGRVGRRGQGEALDVEAQYFSGLLVFGPRAGVEHAVDGEGGHFGVAGLITISPALRVGES